MPNDEIVTTLESVEKPWYQSKGVMGGLVAFVAILASSAGLGDMLTTEDHAEIVSAAIQVVAAVSAMVAVWGRMVAKASIVARPKS
jgi:hypothetical protein